MSRRKSSCKLSWLSDVAVKVGRQPGLSRPQIRIITSISRSIPREVPSRMKPKPGRTTEPSGKTASQRTGAGWGVGVGVGPAAHLVGQIGQQVEDKVAHPLDELLKGLQRGPVQDKLLRLQVDHHLVDVCRHSGGRLCSLACRLRAICARASASATSPESTFLAQKSLRRSPGLLSRVWSTWGRSRDLRVELMAMSSSLAWKSQARAAVAVDSLHSDALTATMRVARTCGSN